MGEVGGIFIGALMAFGVALLMRKIWGMYYTWALERELNKALRLAEKISEVRAAKARAKSDGPDAPQNASY